MQRAGAALGVVGFAAVATIGAAVVLAAGDDPTMPVVAGDPGSACSDLRITGPEPVGPGRSIEVRVGHRTILEGETSGPAGWSVTTGELDGEPATELEIAWFSPCYLLLVGHGVSEAELADYVAGRHLIDRDGGPLLDPRGVVWPETAQSNIPSSLPDERLSAAATAYAFAREVFGWNDVIEEPEPVAEEAHDGRCDTTVAVRRASEPDRTLGLNLSLAVGRRWWSVCRVSWVPGGDPGTSVSIRGSTATVLATGELPEGTASASARFDYGGRVAWVPTGEPSDLGFVPDSSGSVLLLFYDADGEVVGAWGHSVPAGDLTIGDAAGPAGPAGPHAVVVSQHGVMGWWDGESWRDPVDWSGVLPYVLGDRFTIAHLDGTTTTATAGEARSEEFCYPSGTNGIAFDPELPLTWTGDVDWIAVRADWDVVPRPTTSLDPTSPPYVDAVEEQLRAAGIERQPIVIVQALRTDLEGDGVDEVLLTAEHPDANRGNPPRAGWYSMVLLRQVVDGAVVTAPMSLTTYTEDDNSYPTMAVHRVSAVADLNGDGRMEVVTGTDYFEGGESRVFDIVDGEPRTVLTGFCGV